MLRAAGVSAVPITASRGAKKRCITSTFLPEQVARVGNTPQCIMRSVGFCYSMHMGLWSLRMALAIVLAFAIMRGGDLGGLGAAAEDNPPRSVSVRDGRWSDPSVWEPQGVPLQGATVRITKGTTVTYDLVSDRELASVEIHGALYFSREQSSRMDSGNIVIREGGALELGTARRPIPRSVTAEIRLVVPEGAVFKGGGDFQPEDVGIWVFHGGRWEVHGAPIRHTWVKLARPAKAGDTQLVVRGDLSDWPRGADIVVTPTSVRPEAPDFEERKVESTWRLPNGLHAVRLSRPLERAHDGSAEFAGEVALLTRNVRISSKYPTRAKTHTMYMHGADGSIAYGEFRDLGTLGVLGRYPIHFHLMADSSRGMYVRGASIWRSDNHFLNIHGSNAITIEDTVGYDVAGSGFFLESIAGEPTQSSRARERPAAQPGQPQLPPDTADPQARKRTRVRALPFHNLDNLFIHNFAAKGFWRTASLDRPNVALFWISSLNTVLIDNVAVGSNGGKHNAGFRITSSAPFSADAVPLTMVANEAHGNDDDGLLTWINSKPVLDVVGFNAWRNGRSGIVLGAYDHRIRIFRAQLREHAESNIAVWVVRGWIQDSALRGSPYGVFFHRHSLPSNPADPTLIVTTRFQDHTVADASQDHRACESREDESTPSSRKCSANYVVFARPSFLSQRPVDFGWHRNANTWFEVLDWQPPVQGLPASFRIWRKDRADTGPLVAAFDGRVAPIQRSWDYPPSIEIDVRPTGQRLPSAIISARSRDDRGIVATEFFVNGVLLKRLDAPPYEAAWSWQATSAQSRYVWARTFDTGGNVAYSQVVRLNPASP